MNTDTRQAGRRGHWPCLALQPVGVSPGARERGVMMTMCGKRDVRTGSVCCLPMGHAGDHLAEGDFSRGAFPPGSAVRWREGQPWSSNPALRPPGWDTQSGKAHEGTSD